MLLDKEKEEDRLKIWNKARIVDDYDSTKYRKDSCGAWMAYERYGDTDNDYGWEIDHIYPESKGGGDDIANLRAMNWRNNRKKGDDYPHYHSIVTSEDNKNIEYLQFLEVNETTQKMVESLYLKK